MQNIQLYIRKYSACFRSTQSQLQAAGIIILTQHAKEAAPCIIIGYNCVGGYFHDTMTVLRISAVVLERRYLSYRQLVSRFYGIIYYMIYIPLPAASADMLQLWVCLETWSRREGLRAYSYLHGSLVRMAYT